MALFDRVKSILVTPRTEWPEIAREAATIQTLYTGYVMILAAIGPLALMVRGSAVAGLLAYALSLGVTYVLAWIVDALAPTFGGTRDFVASLKLTAYSYTAAWLAGIFQLLPVLGPLVGLVAAVYSFFTFYLGAPVVKKVSPDKAAIYTIVIVVCGIALGVVLSAAVMSLLFGGTMGGAGLGTIR